MGLLGDIGKIIIGTVLGGPAGGIAVFTVEHGAEVLEGTIDVGRQIVEIGEDIYRAAPPELFVLVGSPLHGVLKHEFEDELIMLGEIAGEVAIFSGLFWPALGPVGATLEILQGGIPLFVSAGSIVGKLSYRLMNDQEWEMARYFFRDSLFDREEITLTNLGGLDGRPFVFPSTLGPIYVNLGNAYVHNATILDGPLLFHELTHVWQGKQRGLNEIYLYDTIPDALLEEYEFNQPNPDNQWDDYGTEQQAGIVEAWALGATRRTRSSAGNLTYNTGAQGQLSINTPLFRFINGNIRRSDDGATTGSGSSVRQLLVDGGHETVKAMHPASPPTWW